MKKIVTIALLSVSSAAAFAAPTKTSKPVPMTETAMAAVRGQGTLYVMQWMQLHHTRPYQYVPISMTPIDGPDQYQYHGGPLDNT